MLLMLSLSGIWGLSSYANLIGELEFSIQHAPHKSNLVAATTALFEPLTRSFPQDASAAELLEIRRANLKDFTRQIEDARKARLKFLAQLDELPVTGVSDSQSTVLLLWLRSLEDELNELAGLTSSIENQNQIHEAEISLLFEGAGKATRVAHDMPDPAKGLTAALRKAQNDYQSTFTLLWTITAVAVTLFLGLIRYGYLHIFRPIRELYEGARRVAQGDFDYRIKITTHDEMGELAESFNLMTSRFQDIAGDLDRKVDERSKQLVRSERLAGVGFLAAGVAHEINNPLAAIAMAAESIEERGGELLESFHSDDTKVVRNYLQMIQREAFRCREITTKMLDFSRGSESQRQSTNVTGLVQEVISMVQHLSKYHAMQITLQTEQTCYLEVNGPEIKQVILNLVANGLESMEPGGTLSINVLEQTDEIRIIFHDEGCGMTPEVRGNLFEPFFTCKKVGRGTGLGLSISHRIVSEHGGTIDARSDGPGQGSTFYVRLPRRAANVAA